MLGINNSHKALEDTHFHGYLVREHGCQVYYDWETKKWVAKKPDGELLSDQEIDHIYAEEGIYHQKYRGVLGNFRKIGDAFSQLNGVAAWGHLFASAALGIVLRGAALFFVAAPLATMAMTALGGGALALAAGTAVATGAAAVIGVGLSVGIPLLIGMVTSGFSSMRSGHSLGKTLDVMGDSAKQSLARSFQTASGRKGLWLSAVLTGLFGGVLGAAEDAQAAVNAQQDVTMPDPAADGRHPFRDARFGSDMPDINGDGDINALDVTHVDLSGIRTLEDMSNELYLSELAGDKPVYVLESHEERAFLLGNIQQVQEDVGRAFPSPYNSFLNSFDHVSGYEEGLESFRERLLTLYTEKGEGYENHITMIYNLVPAELDMLRNTLLSLYELESGLPPEDRTSLIDVSGLSLSFVRPEMDGLGGFEKVTSFVTVYDPNYIGNEISMHPDPHISHMNTLAEEVTHALHALQNNVNPIWFDGDIEDKIFTSKYYMELTGRTGASEITQRLLEQTMSPELAAEHIDFINARFESHMLQQSLSFNLRFSDLGEYRPDHTGEFTSIYNFFADKTLIEAGANDTIRVNQFMEVRNSVFEKIIERVYRPPLSELEQAEGYLISQEEILASAQDVLSEERLSRRERFIVQDLINTFQRALAEPPHMPSAPQATGGMQVSHHQPQP